MGDRTYWNKDNSGGYGGGGRMSFGMPKPGPAVGWLLIINFAMFIIQQIAPSIENWLTVIPVVWWEPWRYITFQFLHGGVMHILLNMLGLYFLGMHLERAWGAKRFLRFYLICGAFAGMTHVALTFLSNGNPDIPLLGASGGVFAVILACAILFPGIRLILLFFPVPIRFAAVLFFGISLLSLLSGKSGGVSHAAHFGGMVIAGVWIWLLPKVKDASTEARTKAQQGAWQRKMQKKQANQEVIDRILDKIKVNGIGSLSNREKKILQDATDQQRQEEKRINKL